MKWFQLVAAPFVFQKRLSDVEDAIAEIRRLVRNQDLDVSDAIEKMQTLSARLAKRTRRGVDEGTPPPENDPLRANAEASRRILERRSRTSSLAEEMGNGLLPKR